MSIDPQLLFLKPPTQRDEAPAAHSSSASSPSKNPGADDSEEDDAEDDEVEEQEPTTIREDVQALAQQLL